MQVRILSNINSGQYVAGDVVDFPDAEAQTLIDAGVAEAFVEGAAPLAAPVADGFPVHEPEAPAPVPELPAAPAVAPEVPAAPEATAPAAPLEELPSDSTPSPTASADSSSASSALKQPTPEQIAQDVAGL